MYLFVLLMVILGEIFVENSAEMWSKIHNLMMK
jgi:hypothetical protein